MNQKMNRIAAKVVAILLAVILVITSFSYVFLISTSEGVVYGAQATAAEDRKLDSEIENLEDLIQMIRVDYKDDITYDLLLDGAYQGIFEALNDPYSVYFTAEEGESFVESVDGEFSGIGVSIEDYNGQCRVVAPIADTPASKAGIKSGDIIVKVDGKDVTKMDIDAISTLLRGIVGTKVTVTVSRSGATLNFTMTRETIKLSSVTYEMLDGNIGYLSLSQFDNDSDNEFRKAKAALIAQGAKSFIVDVRDNPGGYVSVAAEIAEMMMPAGAISYFEQQGEMVESIMADGSGDTDYPIVLLVNEGSASASEILAGAWQDSGSAKLVGTTTFGKGVAQQVLDLENGDEIKLSMFYFLTPDKKVINHVGITPDYYVANYDTTLDLEALQAEYLAYAPMSEKVKPTAGTTGLNVYGAQQRLALLGYQVTVTGTMDQATVAAVKAFQASEGFKSYGVLDYSTMQALDRASVEYVTGVYGDKDAQLAKAIELLK